MARNDETGAIAAAEYFMTVLYPYTFNSVDTGPWLAMSDPGCRFCSSIVEYVVAMRDAGESAQVAPMTAEDPRYRADGQGSYTVTFAFSTGTDNTFGPDGTLKSSTPPATGTAAFQLLRTDGQWVISEGNADPDETGTE